MDEWDDGDGDVLTVENPRAERRRAAVMLGGLLIVALGLAWVLSSGSDGESGTSAPATVAGAAVTFEVRPGQTVRSVGDDLAALDVISSTLRFRRIATDVALERVLRPGRFEMTVGMGEQAAVDRLAAGPVEGLRRPTLRIQVIEGLLLTDTLATIADDLPHLEVADLEVVSDQPLDGAVTTRDAPSFLALSEPVVLEPGFWLFALRVDPAPGDVELLDLRINGVESGDEREVRVPEEGRCIYTPTPDVYPDGAFYWRDGERGEYFIPAYAKVEVCAAIGRYDEFQVSNAGDIALDLWGFPVG